MWELVWIPRTPTSLCISVLLWEIGIEKRESIEDPMPANPHTQWRVTRVSRRQGLTLEVVLWPLHMQDGQAHDFLSLYTCTHKRTCTLHIHNMCAQGWAGSPLRPQGKMFLCFVWLLEMTIPWILVLSLPNFCFHFHTSLSALIFLPPFYKGL